MFEYHAFLTAVYLGT